MRDGLTPEQLDYLLEQKRDKQAESLEAYREWIKPRKGVFGVPKRGKDRKAPY